MASEINSRMQVEGREHLRTFLFSLHFLHTRIHWCLNMLCFSKMGQCRWNFTYTDQKIACLICNCLFFLLCYGVSAGVGTVLDLEKSNAGSVQIKRKTLSDQTHCFVGSSARHALPSVGGKVNWLIGMAHGRRVESYPWCSWIVCCECTFVHTCW